MPALLSVLLLVLAPAPAPPSAPIPAPAPAGGREIDYGPLVDRRALTHSGESVGTILDRLGGRPLPPEGERPADRLDHVLLEPLLEPYAFVLADAADALAGGAPRRWVEVGGLWAPSDPQPAWVDLLRTRRYVVETDGAGALRAFLPGERGARGAWDAAWPVLRHVVASERRRGPEAIRVTAYAYRHEPARTRFVLDPSPYETTLTGPLPGAGRPVPDLAAWERTLRTLRLEGARLEPDGMVRLVGSEAAAPPTVLGRPLALSDLAVAWRAVAHGGLAEPYMSLDRGDVPWSSIVSHGGRLRDTSLGLVSLLCDVRFKTFSLGLDPHRAEDARARIREALPDFRTHLERFAADPASATTGAAQTRLWFYPDAVEMVLSESGDAFLLRRARMSAASERMDVAAGEGRAEPAWTRETTAAIDRTYDGLARQFPELGDLDTTVRLLSLASWLRQARDAGLPVPDLDALLAVELPSEPTPRSFPQAVARVTLPAAPGGPVEVLDEAPLAAALDRLRPAEGGRLAAPRRAERAAAQLDPRRPDQAALIPGLRDASADPAALDARAWQAERLRLHQLVLARPGAAGRAFSVGIGGLDLGMSRALARAPRRSGRLFGAGGGAPARAAASAPPAPAGAPSFADLPPAAPLPLPAGAGPVVTGASGDAPRARGARRDNDLLEIDRLEDGRRLRYAVEAGPDAVRLVPRSEPAPAREVAPPPAAPLPEGLATLEVLSGGTETPAVRVRLRAGARPARETDVPRPLLQRIVLGKDLAADGPDRLPLPADLGVRRVMVLAGAERAAAPWMGVAEAVPGEEDPWVLAGALADGRVVGSDPVRSPGRWASAPAVGARPVLLLPEDGFPGASAPLRETLSAAWTAGPVVREAAAVPAGRDLVVLVAAEGPDALGRRVDALARDPRLAGRVLAVWSWGGGVRSDLAIRALAEGGLAGLGLARRGPAGRERAPAELGRYAAGLAAAARPEETAGPFVWLF